MGIRRKSYLYGIEPEFKGGIMTQNEKNEAIDYIMSQLEYGYIDLGCHDERELEIIRQAMTTYVKFPEIIQELENLKMSMDGQIFYNQTSRLIYEERMESTNETVNEAISIVKGLIGNEETSSDR